MPGIQELLVIALVALLVFGPNRLPEAARTAGRTLARLRAELQRTTSGLTGPPELTELGQELTELRRELDATRRDLLGTGRAQPLRDVPARRAPGRGPSARRAGDGTAAPFDPEAT